MKNNCMRHSTGQDTIGTLEGENIRVITDVIEFYEKKDLPGMLLFSRNDANILQGGS